MKDKIYFERYYQDHKAEYKKRNEELCPKKRKSIKSKYYKKHRKKLLKYAKEYHRLKTEGIFVSETKGKAIRPFKKRISLELQDKIKENTKINNSKIKFYDMVETRDTFLVQNLLKLKEIKV